MRGSDTYSTVILTPRVDERRARVWKQVTTDEMEVAESRSSNRH
jgi:hypothetical protein